MLFAIVAVMLLASGGIEALPGRVLDAAEDRAGPAADRVAEWLDKQVRAIRDEIRALVHEFGDTAEPGNRDKVRIYRGPPTASRPALSGLARVVDGDTLHVNRVRVRLQRHRRAGKRPALPNVRQALALRAGSDTGPGAPESAGRPVACEERDRDRYGRVVAVCTVGGRDLNRWMVAEGWAFAYRRYSRDYVAAESRARAARQGIWRGEAVAPWDWRRGKRLSGSGAPAARRDGGRCRIKGNIGRNGNRVYHVPGGQFYDRTRIDTSRGERWFCSESAARAAGWRRSRR